MQHITKVINQLRGKLARQLTNAEDTRQHIEALLKILEEQQPPQHPSGKK